jgi:cytochrome c553
MRPWLKHLGIGAAGMVTLSFLAIAGVYGFSSTGINRTYDVPKTALSVPIPTDSASIEWGHHIATAIGKCTDCHGPDLAGQTMIDDPAFGTLATSNLTRGKGGIGATYTDEDYVRALRHGLRPDGSALIFMPSQEFTYMSDQDMASLIAYIKSVPAVDKEKVKTRVGPIARMLYVTKQMPLIPAEMIDHKASTRSVVPAGPTAEYGKYLARIGGCQGCHRDNLAGGPMPGAPPKTPPAANLTPAHLGTWSLADFTKALREGTRPDGSKINALMPYVYTRNMTDEEIAAVWAYLKTLPSTPSATH